MHRLRFRPAAAIAAALLTASASLAADAPPARPAAKGPSLRLNVYFASDFTDAGYPKAAFDKVLAAWKPPTAPRGKKAVLVSTIRRDGSLAEAYFNLETGDAAFDKAAVDALKKAAPFAPLPPAFKRDTVEVHWHFAVEK